MLLKQLTDSLPGWVCPQANASEPVVACQCLLSRNLADFIFPRHCSNDERRAVEARILNALGGVRNLSDGQYYPAAELNTNGMRVLAERFLTSYYLLDASGPRGVFVSHDQNLAITINMSDHILIRTAGNGDISSTWALADTLDSALAGMLQYACHERLGYLTQSLHQVGTGLRIAALLHLPALNILGGMERVGMPHTGDHLLLREVSLGAGQRHGQPTLPPLSIGFPATEVEPVLNQCIRVEDRDRQPDQYLAAGNAFVLTNKETLGISEIELLAEMNQGIAALVTAELEYRERLLREHRTLLLDSVGRALGIARNAQCLGMRESLMLASMVRLADALGLATGCDRAALTGMLMTCQQAHLQHFHGVEPDPLALATERARMFRSLFAAVKMN